MDEPTLFGPEEAPRVFMQWKGTDVCMDVECVCGAGGHVHGMFAYFLKCGACGRFYAMPAHIALHPVPEAEVRSSAAVITFSEDEWPSS